MVNYIVIWIEVDYHTIRTDIDIFDWSFLVDWQFMMSLSQVLGDMSFGYAARLFYFHSPCALKFYLTDHRFACLNMFILLILDSFFWMCLLSFASLDQWIFLIEVDLLHSVIAVIKVHFLSPSIEKSDEPEERKSSPAEPLLLSAVSTDAPPDVLPGGPADRRARQCGRRIPVQ